jgi:hypothetical protein
VAYPAKKKVLWAAGIFAILAVLAFGGLLLLLTSGIEVQLAQDPNSVEEHEANRKLNLLNDAQANKRRGFVRLSEVEINSFLEGRYNGRSYRTNSPVQLVKSCVQLNPPHLVFTTWHTRPVLGLNLPFVWQRTLVPVKKSGSWCFSTRQMRVGRVEIPERFWPEVERFLGECDRTFEERTVWLAHLPAISLTRNELSQAPELRLYTYLPESWRP